MNSKFLLKEFDKSHLREVRMQLNLIHHRLDLSIGPEINEKSYCAVAHTDVFYKASFDEALELTPDFVQWYVQDLSVLNLRDHPMNKVQVNVLKLQLLEAAADCRLHIVLLLLMDFCGDPQLLTLDPLCQAFLDCPTNCFLILIETGGVNVSVAMLQDGYLDYGLNISL
jgi:hypothetical protein